MIGILLVVAFSFVILCRYHAQGAIVAKDFSHDLRLLHYLGWQYTLRQPANYQDYKTLKFRLWHDEYEANAPTKLLKSNRPETAWSKPTGGLARHLPIDILIEQYPTVGKNHWGYTATLDYSGTGNKIAPNENTFSSISIAQGTAYKEGSPMPLGELTIYSQEPYGVRLFRFYLEISYVK